MWTVRAKRTTNRQPFAVNAHARVYFSLMEPSDMQQMQSSDSRDVSERSFVTYALIALAVALCVRFFIAAPYVVSGASMEPTFDNWDYLITDRVSYRLGAPERGDVVIFKLPQEESRTLIKRVIGLPGESVSLQNGSITIINEEHPEGFTLSEPYLSSENVGALLPLYTTLGEDEYFVLGDNRRVSADSRTWGTLPEREIIGKVFVRLFPFTHIALLPGEVRYEE